MGFCPNCGLVFPDGMSTCPLDESTLSDRRDPFEGMILAGKYRVIERIGMGGMGYVYRGQHVHVNRDVAIKILPVEATSSVDLTEMKARFVREARAADMVRHRNIVEVYEIGEGRRNVSFIVMEYLEGRTLEDVIADRKITLGLVVSVMRQICSVLGPTHAMGIIHRDLKPENVFLVQRDGRDDFVKILDFGVAHLASEPGLTVAGQVLGTPEYMSPEQARGERPGPPADLYALGCMAYDMIAGHPPFHQGNMMEIMRQQIMEPPAPLLDKQPRLPRQMETIVMTLLEKDPAARYPDAFAVLRDLDAFLPEKDDPQTSPAPRDSRLDFGTGAKASMQSDDQEPPHLLVAWRALVARHSTVTDGQKRRILYEMEEQVGQLESLVQMMEQICAVMDLSIEERRQEGRRIRHAIAKFAQSSSLKRSTLMKRRRRYDELTAALSDLDRQIAVQLVQIRSCGAIEVGTTLDGGLVEECVQLGNLARNRQQVSASVTGLRDEASTLMDQIRDTGVQIDSMRERLESIISVSASKLAEQQERIESLEQERARVEERLCQLAARLTEGDPGSI